MRVVVLGGYGNFGARICRALSGDPSIELIVAGRDRNKASAFISNLNHSAQAAVVDIDRDDLSSQLKSLDAQLVIHTAGPFQQQNYRVAVAACDAGAHYIDLADGRRFVCDFGLALNDNFIRAGRCAISGASTVPALSSAVVNELTRNWLAIESIDLCIAPAQTAPRGLATMAAVLSYCGEPISVWENGAWQTEFGWCNPSRVEFARMKPRLAALCDIPDLELFPAYYGGIRNIYFRAALEVKLSQYSFAFLARLRMMGLIKRPEKWASFFLATAKYFDVFGSRLGGMVVRASGCDQNNQALSRSWHIAADHDYGPEIPCMAAILLARKLAKNSFKKVGAFSAMNLLDLDAFSPEFAKWGMQTDIVEDVYEGCS